ncbi:DUF6368 family protein [Streptomyces sp. NPDC007905]|uniref:DUF6368 family protein n=1 Tax=Streptomyces sp. NPDC007905 TaxID=3364788 RepID=UPI0036E49378
MLVVELAEAVPRAAIQRLRDLLVRSSARFEEKRVGEYDLNIHTESLGISEPGGVDGRRPVLVSVMGPGIGDESISEAEHADEVDQESLIGFTPTHAVNVVAFCNRPVGHCGRSPNGNPWGSGAEKWQKRGRGDQRSSQYR